MCICRKSATLSHPGAMYRLGIADLKGELGLSRNPRDGVKWLKRSAESANEEFPHALHELFELHEKDIENIVFVYVKYSIQLLAQAPDLSYAPSAYKLTELYEYGKKGCPPNPSSQFTTTQLPFNKIIVKLLFHLQHIQLLPIIDQQNV